ncbi:MAG: hypothetical protein DRP49_06860, partial [Spirochaetes bacterium]
FWVALFALEYIGKELFEAGSSSQPSWMRKVSETVVTANPGHTDQSVFTGVRVKCLLKFCVSNGFSSMYFRNFIFRFRSLHFLLCPDLPQFLKNMQLRASRPALCQ